MFPGGTGGYCISVLKCFIQGGTYNMLVKQPLVNEGFLLLSIILKDLNDCFIFLFSSQEQTSNGNQSENECRAIPLPPNFIIIKVSLKR